MKCGQLIGLCSRQLGSWPEKLQALYETYGYCLPGSYSLTLEGADALQFYLEGNCSAVVRPSGMEPKLNSYVLVCAKTREASEEPGKSIMEALKRNIFETAYVLCPQKV